MKRDIPSLPPDRIELAKIKERSLDLISVEELDRLLSAPYKLLEIKKNSDRQKILRDKAILELFFQPG
jgi:site-specific recombinase XerD